ncbi:hypothetical protein B0T22DRAFT_439002 [Podospora appendiculata]|uniref:Clr5 domain-containing protein n=1 Tax=Podospora appendiculata TaxID=314037 RepID=A0AAE1CBE9_9PEZI|nr:hypothetical protein B0T22DRAFT_439002 [Podospora appendiculata]
MASSQSQEIRFVGDGKSNAARIPEEEWERHKEVIIRKFRQCTLQQVKDQMEKEHEFYATKRQYVHRVGHKWGEKKYKIDPDDQTTKKRRGQARKSASPKSSATPPGRRSSGEPGPGPRINHFAPSPGTTTASGPPGPGQGPGGMTPIVFPASAEPKYSGGAWAGPVSVPSYRPPGLINNTQSHRHHADMFFALGDSQSAHHIYRALYQQDDALRYVVACVRTGQTEKQASEARDLLQMNLSHLLDKPDDGASSNNFLLDLAVARSYDRGTDQTDAIGQFEQLIQAKVDDTPHVRLKKLRPRGPQMDMVLYQEFSYGMRRFNQFTDVDEDEVELDIGDILEQFISHQPAFQGRPQNMPEPLSKVPALRECLQWCIQELQQDPPIPGTIRNLPRENKRTDAYTIICTLWSVWQSRLSYPGLSGYPAFSLSWASDSESQLGISASELLTAVVCMFMATTTKDGYKSPSSPIERAWQKADSLAAEDSVFLLRRFLSQMRKTGEQRMVPQDGDDAELQPYDVNAESAPFRAFIAQSLRGFQLPPAEAGAITHPLVLDNADSDREEMAWGTYGGSYEDMPARMTWNGYV